MVDQCCLITELGLPRFQVICLCIHEHAKKKSFVQLKVKGISNKIF